MRFLREFRDLLVGEFRTCGEEFCVTLNVGWREFHLQEKPRSIGTVAISTGREEIVREFGRPLGMGAIKAQFSAWRKQSSTGFRFSGVQFYSIQVEARLDSVQRSFNHRSTTVKHTLNNGYRH